MKFLKTKWRAITSVVVVCATGWMFVASAGLPGWAGAVCGGIGCAVVGVSLRLRPKLGYLTSWAAAGALTGSVFFVSGLFVSGDRIENARAMGAAGVLTVAAVAGLVVPPQIIKRIIKVTRGRFRGRAATSRSRERSGRRKGRT